MCGRYAFGIRAAFVRHQLEEDGMPVDDAPEDDEVRETYNFAPGYYGLVYRADVPDYGAGGRPHDRSNNDVANPEDKTAPQDSEPLPTSPPKPSTQDSTPSSQPAKPTRYILQPMKWGLVPFWTKRSPDYPSLLRTINCRDDSLLENRGMWTTMKSRKRCLIIAQGFYEWLKKGPNDKIRVPHYVKRADGKLMLFAGLWDCVKYEGEGQEKLYSYTIITTDSNERLKFLHDRMPVILEPGSDGVRTWLDPGRSTWSKELQSLLKPFKGELEVYPVSQEVGKVGNNSPNFVIPVDSRENKKNIANFFANAKGKKSSTKEEKVKSANQEHETTISTELKDERTEDNAPMPTPTKGEEDLNDATPRKGTKRRHTPETESSPPKPTKAAKTSDTTPKSEKPEPSSSPEKLKLPSKPAATGRKARNATSNETKGKMKGSPVKETAADGTQRITNFFVK